MAQIADDLRQRLLGIRRTACAGSAGRYFYSRVEVEEVLGPDTVRQCLALIPRLAGNERDIDRFASLIRESSLLIWAILLSDGNQARIMDFLFRRDTDDRIPYSEDSLYYLDPILRAQFVQRQWEFHPVVLERHDIPRDIHPNAILPILSETRKGSGGFGTVWETTLYPTCQSVVPSTAGQSVIIARKELTNGDTGANERAVLELLRTLKHPNIIEFLGAYRYRGATSLLFPLAAQDLGQFLLAVPRLPMDAPAIYAAVHGLADALCRIHHFSSGAQEGTVGRIGYHHDLRPPNILLHSGTFVIADFGLSKLRPDDQDSRTRLSGGDDDYHGPEAFNYNERLNGLVGRPLDVWALGCILAELATFIEGKDVAEFRARRKATHEGAMEATDYAFHLGGRVRPAVKQWLDELVRAPRDPQAAGLVQVARDMLNPNRYRRVKMKDVVPRLELLAIDSAWGAVDHVFQSLACVGDAGSLSDQAVLAMLEHKRLRSWRTVFDSVPLGQRLEISGAVLAAMGRLRVLLKEHQSLRGNSVPTPPLVVSGPMLAEIDILCERLPDHSRQALTQLWSQKVCGIDDMQVLETLRLMSKPERYRLVGIGAAMKHMSSTISRSIRFGRQSRYKESGMIDLDGEPSLFSSAAGLVYDASKTMGYLDDGGGRQRVLVEWKTYDAHWKNETEKLQVLMDDLTNLLDVEVTPRVGAAEYRILNCLGYFHETRNFRFGFLYALRDPKAIHLFSLNNVLRLTAALENDNDGDGLLPGDDSPPPPMLPDLGDIFLLAKDLSSCLLAVHQAGWLHKNLSSHHVLVFTPDQASVSQHVASAVLSGFNDSRPEASGFTLGPSREFMLYRHPSYVPGVPFQRAFDYFGLGVVLLEMGLWLPISKLRELHPDQPTPEAFRLKLLQFYVPQLGERMGARYREAVRFCLDAEGVARSEMHDPGDVETLHSLFKERVVDLLAGCLA